MLITEDKTDKKIVTICYYSKYTKSSLIIVCFSDLYNIERRLKRYGIKNEEKDPYIIIVECKHHIEKNTIGVELVRTVNGVRDFNNAGYSIVVTSSKFSPEAKKLSVENQHKICLQDGKEVLELIYEYRWNRGE